MSKSKTPKINWDEFAGLKENEIEKKAQEILSLMTLREKARLMSGDKPFIPSVIPMLIRYNKKPYVAGEVKRLGNPGIRFADGPRGCVMGNSTCFPVSMARGASWDPELEEKIGNIIGIEARSQGANFFGGVCINLLRHPAWGRAQETYGEDPHHLGVMGAALTKGTQNHIMACAKHYACNSMENARFKIDVSVDERTLREIYLYHFRKCVEAGVASIMSAYNQVNGHYCGHNKHLLRDILKEDWGFKGIVITDFVFGVRNGEMGANAGVDIEMPLKWRMKPKKLEKLVKKGRVPEEYINEAALRSLRQQIRFAKKQDPKLYNLDKIACKEHVQVALEAARKSMVLLKNDNNLLPLKRSDVKKIAVIGKLANMENTGDKGSSRVYAPYVVTPLEGIKKIAGDSIDVSYNDVTELESALDVAKNADVAIIVVGYTHRDEGEYVFSKGGDRSSLELRPQDEQLISAIASVNKNCVVVLVGGSAIILESWKDKIPTILMAWYSGMEGGTALGEILFGDVNPSGKLPFIVPKSADHLPYFDIKARAIEYGYYHGYRLLEKNGVEPTFPFGFGLSYTSFAYSNLQIDKTSAKEGEAIKVSVDISNKGKVAGEEIVQLYIGYKKPSVERPPKELKGFKKISLDAAKTKTVEINLNVKDLAYYDPDKGGWVVEKIEHVLYVGGSSRNEDLLTTTFKVS